MFGTAVKNPPSFQQQQWHIHERGSQQRHGCCATKQQQQAHIHERGSQQRHGCCATVINCLPPQSPAASCQSTKSPNELK
jgi:hypothetical protein